MALISFTSINKNTYLLLLFIVMSAIANIVPDYCNGIVPFDIDLVDYSCQLLISLPFVVQGFFNNKKIFNIFQNFTKIDYIIFALMLVINFIDATIYVMFDETLFFACNIFNRYNIDIFLCLVLSIFTSNSEYYRHHIVGQIIFFIPCTLCDIYRLYNNDRRHIHLNWQHFLVYILDWIVENTVLTYKKYLMEIKFVSPFIVCFFFAAINLSYILILLFFKLTNMNRYVLCFQEKCFNIFDYDLDQFKDNYKLAFTLIISFICDCIFFFFYYNIFNLCTTSHTLFPFFIYVSIYCIKDGQKHNLSSIGWVLMTIGIFLIFFGQFVFLEIIELNFCNLSKFTRNNIAERAKENLINKAIIESFGNFDESSEEEIKQSQTIEFVPGYFIDI